MLNTFCSDLLKYMLIHILLHLIHFPNVHTADFPELILILRKKKCKEAASITA